MLYEQQNNIIRIRVECERFMQKSHLILGSTLSSDIKKISMPFLSIKQGSSTKPVFTQRGL
jgi:hypothetical protein